MGDHLSRPGLLVRSFSNVDVFIGPLTYVLRKFTVFAYRDSLPAKIFNFVLHPRVMTCQMLSHGYAGAAPSGKDRQWRGTVECSLHELGTHPQGTISTVDFRGCLDWSTQKPPQIQEQG